MKKKRDLDSDEESSNSSSQCNDSNCSCKNCPTCVDSDASSSPPSPPPKRSKVVSQKKDVRSSSSQSSSSNSALVQCPKPKFDWKSYLNSSDNSQSTEANSSKTEKRPKNQTSSQKKNEVVDSSTSSSKKSIMPKLRALDKKYLKTQGKKVENEHETDGSELESDFYIEKPSTKIPSNEDDERIISINSESESGSESVHPKKPVKKRAKKEVNHDNLKSLPAIKKDKVAIESNHKKLTSRPQKAEGKECTRFSREEDAAIIAFIDQNTRTVDLMKHLHETFPDRQPRIMSSVQYRRKSILKKCQETILGTESQKE